MSTFGDNTPMQNLLDDIEYIQNRYGLTDEEIAAVVVRVAAQVIDPYEQTSRQAQQKRAAA